MRNVVKLVLATAAVAGVVALSACNTVEGFGKDVERGGEKLQDAAK
jgi:predicted small secreted protein